MKQFFKYIPINLDRRGLYYPNHQIKVGALLGKAVVYDESNYPIKSPNTIYEYGFIDIIDPTIENDIIDLIDTLGVAVGMKAITTTEMITALETNGYVAVNGVYEIVAETEMMGEIIPAITLTI